MKLLIKLLFLLITTSLLRVKATLNCSGSGGQTPTTGSSNPPKKIKDTVFDFGEPVMFISSVSQKLEPYSLIDEHRRTSVMEEYLLVGYKKNETENRYYERLRMVLIDEVKNINTHADTIPDLIHQNLEKELYWEYFRSTGVLPSIKITNATRKEEVSFQIPEKNDTEQYDIAFVATIWENNPLYEPHPPYDAIFEIPINSRVLRSEKTMIQYQSFSLWRWQLSQVVKEWKDIKPALDTDPVDFKRIDNPCIKDLFLLSYQKDGTTDFYLASPLIQSHLQERWFYDMTSDDHPWKDETFLQLVLTNDHLLVLTEHSLWVSESLNGSRIDEQDTLLDGSKTFADRPALNYSRMNPCDQYEDQLHCFSQSSPFNYKLYYNPICYLHQIPNYDDFVILVVEKLDKKDFSVLYGERPYDEWRILFLDAKHYVNRTGNTEERYIIHDIIGIIFNHHIRAFDITIKVHEKEVVTAEDTFRYIRFALPQPNLPFDGYGDLVKDNNQAGTPTVIRELNNYMGDGFVDYKFPDDFIVHRVMMNGDTHDIFFLGDQLWVAESGGPFVYPAITGLNPLLKSKLCKDGFPPAGGTPNPTFIQDCSFNHPDRTFQCINNKRDILFVGKIGAHYSPISVEVESIRELLIAQEVLGWTKEYFCTVLRQRSIFMVGYSGNVLMWYFDEPEVSTEKLREALNNAASATCGRNALEPVLCSYFKRWRDHGCSAVLSGVPQFKMVAFKPAHFSQLQQSTDGPLVPFLLDASTAMLYEAKVPTEADFGLSTGDISNTYLSDVNVGQKIYCRNYALLKIDASDPYEKNDCELFIQHLKTVEGLLDGFRRAVYVTVIKSIPMLPLPVDIAVLCLAKTNKVLVKINDFLNEPPWTFTDDHIGQTLYLPGNMSILLKGFPKANDNFLMEGYSTSYSQYERRLVYNAFYSFLMDLSTMEYRDFQIKHKQQTLDAEEKRIADMDVVGRDKLYRKTWSRKEITEAWNKSPTLPNSPDPHGTGTIFQSALPSYREREEVEAELLTVKDDELHPKLKGLAKVAWDPPPAPPSDELMYGTVPYKDRKIWYLAEPECHYIMSLDHNPVINEGGGRISMDLHDRFSFTVRLRSITPLGKITMHRPLLLLTNSNADLLEVQKIEQLSEEPQMIRLMLIPTGYSKGVATISVRTLVSSLMCRQITSITLTVLLHRDAGRRLFPNYPIPTCKPDGHHGMYPRPWAVDQKGCVTRDEILSTDKKHQEIMRHHKDRTYVAYMTLPVNYRPPSFDGANIPTSRNVYNADPTEPFYHDWYEISKSTRTLNRCKKDAHLKKECDCSENDRLSDDELYSECKQKVFFTKFIGPDFPLYMSMSYDPLMKDSDQIQELFSPKLNWSIIIEEVNGRTEWYIQSPVDQYLRKINTDPKIHYGRKHYNLKNFQVIFLGTGLFHFTATLAPFESFDEVSGHFLVYVNTKSLNHFHIFIIMVSTIIFCLMIVFVRFVRERKRLQALLPPQPDNEFHEKLKVL